MKTIHLRLRKGQHTIKLQNTSLNTTKNKSIRLSRCHVLWTVQNFRDDNNTFLIDTTSTTIPSGYYTFDTLKTLLAKHKITIEKQPNNHIKLTSEKDLNLKNIASVLGFDTNATLAKDTTHTSPHPAEMTRGLKDISIYSNLVDEYRNFSLVNDKYMPSSLLLQVMIDTTQSLNGTISSLDIYQTLPLSDFVGQDLRFDVVSNGSNLDYEIRLVLQIE